MSYGISKTNTNEYLVFWQDGMVRGYENIFTTFEEAYRHAKAFGFGKEPINEI